MPKEKMLFDIANFSGQPTIMGVPRVVLEVLRRIVERDVFEITTICSLPEEEFALRNFKKFFPYELPFQSKNVEYFVLPEKPASTKKSTFRKMEEFLEPWLAENRLFRFMTKTARKVKWAIAPPPFLTERPRSPLLERAIRESDIYFSPFHGFVPEIDVKPSIRKALIVYDVIPVIFAEMYKNHRFFLAEPWKEITPEMIVYSDSECTKRDLLQYFPNVSAEQVTVIPLGADARFVPCSDREKIDAVLEKYGVPRAAPYILSLATLDVRKNFDHVLRSFGRLIDTQDDQFPDLRLVLTGTMGWKAHTIRRAFRKLSKNAQKRVVFTGYVDDADLPLLYNGASCFTYMSLYEGFGLPPLEAMQSGTPVVVSNNSSLPEVVGDAGILLDAKDEDGLVDAFKQVLADASLRETMIEKGLRQARKFNWDRCVDMILEKIR